MSARKYIRAPAADLNTQYTCNILQVQIQLIYLIIYTIYVPYIRRAPAAGRRRHTAAGGTGGWREPRPVA